nr:rhodanese-like domain-containing protein [Oceanococcus sp. HetDA_MAG_MS8]
MSRVRWFPLAAVAIVYLVGNVATADGLGRMEWLVDVRYDIPEVTVDEAKVALANDPAEWVVLDVREPDEFAVSHLPGAVRIPPDADIETFTQVVGDTLADKRVLFYCSVGQRSTKVASRMEDAVREAGGQGVANLRGGIFRWHGAHGPLENASGPVDRIHSYNAIWGKLMPRKNPPEVDTDQTEESS